MSSVLEEIKSRLDIVEFVQSYVRLQKAGLNYKAVCPFHTEKTPSFFVSPSRQIWHCFGGCGEGGDIFKFAMKIEGLDFPEALRLLASRAGVVLKKEDPAIRSERNRLYDICETAAEIFEKSLALTPAVKSYLKKRGVNEESVKEFRLGFAPHSWDFLLKALAARGFKKEEIEKAGLAIKSEDGSSWYDRFRNRIMFPVDDFNGRVVGFGGRIFAEGIKNKDSEKTEAKYVNTPSTPIYDKSKILYGFDKAKNEIRAQNKAVLVEGYMDCLMSHQAGVKNAVAVSGTALTPPQLKTLRRFTDTLISSFDADSAGDSATKRSLALASEFEFERKIAEIPSGKDPADTVLENPASWPEAVKNARNMVEFYFAKVLRENDSKTAEGKKAIGAVLLPLIGEVSNEIEKAHWVGELSQKIGISEESIWKELKRQAAKASGATFKDRTEEQNIRFSNRRELLEERLLMLLTLVRNETSQRELAGRNLIFVSDLNRRLFEALEKGESDAASSELAPHLETLKFKGEVLAQLTKNLDEEFAVCRRELEKECVKEELARLGEDIKNKEEEKDETALATLLANFRELSQKLKNIS